MEHTQRARIRRLTETRYDWQSVAVNIESPKYWESRRSLARVAADVRVRLVGRDRLVHDILDDIRREVRDTRWGVVLVLAEELVELSDLPRSNFVDVRNIVASIHADLCRPRFAGWQPNHAQYRAWHLALAERLLVRLSDGD